MIQLVIVTMDLILEWLSDIDESGFELHQEYMAHVVDWDDPEVEAEAEALNAEQAIAMTVTEQLSELGARSHYLNPGRDPRTGWEWGREMR